MMNRACWLAGLVVTSAWACQARGQDLAALAREAAGGAQASEAKVAAVVGWVNRQFTWTFTDYQKRSVAEIIARRGGNCNEQALVVCALLEQLGVKTRRVREINIQPESRDRQKSAEARIAIDGKRASVFGLRHNDHVWIEFRDAGSGEWLPADATLNLVGMQQWTVARVGFGARPTHSIVPARDMLVPIAIFAVNGETMESRSEHYLIEEFDRVYQGKLSGRASWGAWKSAIRALDGPCRAAFAGKVNLHDTSEQIEEARRIYEKLRRE
jgi:hypothetical protein